MQVSKYSRQKHPRVFSEINTHVKWQHPGLNTSLRVFESPAAVAKCIYLQMLLVDKQYYLAIIAIYGSNHKILVAFQTYCSPKSLIQLLCGCVCTIIFFCSTSYCRLQSSKGAKVGENRVKEPKVYNCIKDIKATQSPYCKHHLSTRQ